MQTRADILAQLRTLLVDMFEVDAGAVTPEARLYEDLDIDSIDAVDLVLQLQQTAGRKIPQEALKSARTVGDVIDAVAALLQI